MLSNDTINEIRSKTNIVDIISKYVNLTKKGKNYFGVCPFHDDHSPSMSVSYEKQIYTCFSCGATGNVFTFIQNYEHISFIDAVYLLGDKLGFDLGKKHVNNLDNKNEEEYKIYDIAHKYYQNNLYTALGKNAINYLENRQINRDIIKKFGIGLSLSKSGLTDLLLSKKHDLSKLVELGLSSSMSNDLFLNRIMFPLHDLNGRVVGFSGRIYNINDNSKYINTKETNIFKKGNILYNYHRAREHLKKNDYILIMEGFMDVIRASSVGIDNCVATMGTAFTKNQAQIVKKMTDNIILCFDGDNAGEDATNAAIKVLEDLDVSPKIIRLEDNLDPDEYILKNGKNAFIGKVKNAISCYDYKINLLKKEKNLSDTKELSIYIDSAIKELVKVDDNILVELTLKKIANEYNLEYATLKEEYNKYKLDKKNIPTIKIKKEKKYKNYETAQRKIIFYMLRKSSVIDKVENKLSYLPDSNMKYLFNEIICYYHKYGKVEIADFISFLSQKEELLNALYEIINMQVKEDYTDEEIDDYIKVIKDYIRNSKIKSLENQISIEADPYKQASILKEILSIKGVR